MSEDRGPSPHLWSRDGFLGANGIALRRQYTPDYLSVTGPHSPNRLDAFGISPDDETDPGAFPSPILFSRNGVEVSLSRRREASPCTFRDSEADQLLLVISGKVRVLTDFGDIEAAPLDFIFLPRCVTYRVEPLSDDLLILSLSSPDALKFDTPAPFGMINFARDVRYAKIAADRMPAEGPHTLAIRAFDGVTRFEMVHDPLCAIAQVMGAPPVWAMSLRDVVPIEYGNRGGPPAQFMSTGDTGVMLYTLSARAGGRPPVHVNADYDEVIVYAEGPGAWGKIDRPGTVTWVPKGVTHHGPIEDVKEGYQAWLIEMRPTMRLTPLGQANAKLMETGEYGFHDEQA